MSGLCWIFSLFLKDVSFRYFSLAVNSLLDLTLLLSVFLTFFKNTVHTVLRYHKFSAGNHLVGAKILFYVSENVFSSAFFIDATKETGTN